MGARRRVERRAMSRLMRFPDSVKLDPAIEGWMRNHSGELGTIAQRWFQVMRNCGNDVRELLHDGHPTACVGDAAFAYVNAFTSHVNVGFFLGVRFRSAASLHHSLTRASGGSHMPSPSCVANASWKASMFL